jgi:hypothetical protein
MLALSDCARAVPATADDPMARVSIESKAAAHLLPGRAFGSDVIVESR